MEEEFDSSFDQPQNTSIASAKGPKRRTKAQLNKTKEKIDIPNISIESNSEGEEPHDSLERITEFPLNPMIGEEYERIEEFYEQCAKQAQERFNVKLDCNVLYTRRYFPSMKECRYVYVTCNFCTCTMTFKQEAEFIKAQRIMRQHRHSVKMVASLTKADIKQRTLQSQRQDPERKKNSSSETVLLEGLKQAIKKLEEDPEDYKHVKSMLKSEMFKMYEHYNEKADELSYPDVLVLVSPTMFQNIVSFGDSIGFQVINRKLSIEYYVAMFCVYDTNARLLIGGMAFMSDDEPDTIAKTFDGLFSIVNIRPRVVRTIQKHSLEKGLARVVSIYPDITHLVDLTKVLVSLRRHLKGLESKQMSILQLINDLLTERDIMKSKILEERLILLAANDNERVMTQLLENSQKVIYTQMPPIYFGFNRSAEQKISDIFKVLFEEKLSVPKFVRSVLMVEKYLQEKISTSESFYQNPIETQFRDPKIKEVRENVERKIFNKFLENYLESHMTYKLQSTEPTDCGGMVVEYKKYNYQFKIVNWKCPCYEVEKTGIPCPHLLLCAKNTPGKSYLELFHQRWFRKPAVKQEPIKIEAHSEPQTNRAI